MRDLLRNHNFWAVLALLVILIIALRISADSRSDITAAEKLLHEVFSPVQAGLQSVKDKVVEIRLTFSEREELEQKLQALLRENEGLKLTNQELRENQAELRRLRQLLELEAGYGEFELRAARVIARSPSNWYQMLSIDKGQADGIAVDMTVISADGGLVGRIGSVSQHSAQVWLLSDREMAVGVIVQETRDSQGIVEGLGDNFYLRMVNTPYYAEVTSGQTVITSGLSGIYPKGIAVGSIVRIVPEDNGLLLTADIEPAVDFDKLEEVLVITEVNNESVPPEEEVQ
ncbi:MAG: rod shape-determining protein MreC [Syntrophomonadaceae bacterium]|nr:rod shape-determining protein MreC [Syntrophomonadaceae bacterium]